MFMDASAVPDNKTPFDAQVAEMDYKLNGFRARADTGDFVGPRWVPDLERQDCSMCHTEFTFTVRKHHCRHCGMIFCHAVRPAGHSLHVTVFENKKQS
jgi:FYVE zinc finger